MSASQPNFSRDFTVIYLTASVIPEKFAEFQRKVLVDAIGDMPYWGQADELAGKYE